MADLAQLALQLGRVLVLGTPADLAEAERAERAEVAVGLADSTTDLRDPQRAHSDTSSGSEAGSSSASCAFAAGAETGKTSAMDLRGSAATSWGRPSRLSPSTVARVMLIGVVVPRLFASTSRMPASSSTARVPPPAITPVPSLAGRS